MKRCFALVLFTAALLRMAAPPARGAEEPAAANLVRRESGVWAAERSATQGERIDCRAVFSACGDRGYVARGRLSDGVDLRRVTALRQNGTDVNASYYTVLERGQEGNRRFEIHFAPGWADAGEVRLEIEYTVSLNERAGTGEQDNLCAVELSGADGTSLAGEGAHVRTHSLTVYRAVSIPEAVKQTNPLSGACFSLYRGRDREERMVFAAGRGGEYTACAGEDCRHSRHTCLLKTPENGTLRLRGLGAGTYYLQETRPPQGCAVSADMLEITVGENGEITVGGTLAADGVIRLVEQTGSEGKKETESDPLAFYEKGCRVLSAVLAALLMARRQLFR